MSFDVLMFCINMLISLFIIIHYNRCIYMLCVDCVWLYVFCVVMFVGCSGVFLCLMGDGCCCLCVDFGCGVV